MHQKNKKHRKPKKTKKHRKMKNEKAQLYIVSPLVFFIQNSKFEYDIYLNNLFKNLSY